MFCEFLFKWCKPQLIRGTIYIRYIQDILLILASMAIQPQQLEMSDIFYILLFM